jgi:hypothetical protein
MLGSAYSTQVLHKEEINTVIEGLLGGYL